MNSFWRLMSLLGFGLMTTSLFLIVLIFKPVAQVELQYQLSKNKSEDTLEPVNRQFGLLIPKIGANSNVVANVDPFDPKSYQLALTQGVAHAKGSAFPGEPGRVFIFSHSSANFYEASRYNSIFYLLSKLVAGDEIKIYYLGEEYDYQVKEKKVVDADETKYLSSGETGLVLMTCWPPGTNFKRLLVFAMLK